MHSKYCWRSLLPSFLLPQKPIPLKKWGRGRGYIRKKRPARFRHGIISHLIGTRILRLGAADWGQGTSRPIRKTQGIMNLLVTTQLATQQPTRFWAANKNFLLALQKGGTFRMGRNNRPQQICFDGAIASPAPAPRLQNYNVQEHINTNRRIPSSLLLEK